MNCDLRNRSPRVEKLPDGRLRVYRLYDVLSHIPKTPTDLTSDLWLAWGTIDSEFTDCRLVKQDVEGQGVQFPDETKRPPVLTRIYEEIPATSEVVVGNPTVIVNQAGYREVTFESLQLAVGTAILQIPGTTAAPSPYGTLILRDQKTTDDGTLRHIQRIYVEGGFLDQVDTLKFNGKVLVRRLKYLNEVPPTPTGFVLVEHSKYFVNGLPIYDYGYASGNPTGGGGGQISSDERYVQSSDQGTTGATITTISYVVEPGGSMLPASLLGSVLISKEYTDDAGFRVWKTVWAKGTGEVSRETETKNNGMLSLRTIRYLTTSAAGQPTPTDIADYVLASYGKQESDGYAIWTLSYAKGAGEIARDFTNSSGGAVDFNSAAPTSSIGPVKCVITHLTASSVTTDPTTRPTNFIRVAIDHRDSDGHRIWTVTFGYGTGLIVDATTLENGGKLVRYHRIALGAWPTAPDATLGGTVAIVASNLKHDDGHDVYDRTYAEGVGYISRSDEFIQSSDQGTGGITKVTIRYLTALAQATLLPATLDGFINVGKSYADQDGSRIWTTIWAKGIGEVSRDVSYNQSSAGDGTVGATITKIVHLTAAGASDPTTPPSGTVLIALNHQEEGGFWRWDVTYAKGLGTVLTEIEVKHNISSTVGKLYLYHRIGLGAAPTTPSASISGTVVLTSSDVRESEGYKIYDYRWAEGVGEINRDITYQQSANQGTIGATIATIRYLVAPGGSMLPATLEGYVRIAESNEDGSGYRIWTTRWAKGDGLVALSIHARQDGLREATYIYLGAKPGSPPSGVLIRDDYRIDEGYSVYILTYIQAADGSTAVTSVSFSFQRYVPFLYPGRAKAYHLTAQNGWEAYDVFRSPPVRTDVKATITVTYQTSNALGTISDYWNPTAWAVIQAEWITLDNVPGFAVVALPGYRSVSETPLTFTAGVWEEDTAGTMLGNVVYGNTTAKLTVTGGPADPGGNTYTLDATIEPAFTEVGGTVYYRKTLVSAAIPAQTALPV